MIATALPLVLLVALAATAQPASPEAPAKPQAREPAKADAPAWTWTPGRELHYRATASQTATSSGMIGFSMTSEQVLGFSTKVLSTAADGSAVLEYRLESLRITLTPSPTTKPVTVDSAAPPSAEEFDPNAAARALVGASLTLTLARDGAVRTVAGLPELRALVKRAFAEPPVLADLAEPLLAAVNDRTISAAVGTAFALAEPSSATPALALRGVGLLTAKPTTTRETRGAELRTNRVIDYAVATPNADPAAKSFDITATQGRQETSAVAVPAEGRLASFTSSLTLALRFTPRPGVKDASEITRTLTQSLKIEPASPPPPAAPGTP